jgi:hypothetical protein
MATDEKTSLPILPILPILPSNNSLVTSAPGGQAYAWSVACNALCNCLGGLFAVNNNSEKKDSAATPLITTQPTK